jgi:hypothetical protein
MKFTEAKLEAAIIGLLEAEGYFHVLCELRGQDFYFALRSFFQVLSGFFALLFSDDIILFSHRGRRARQYSNSLV